MLLLDYARMGLPDASWRISGVNRNFAMCETYPEFLGVPVSVDDATVEKASQFRTKHRVPALAYRHRAGGGGICRSSQPQVCASVVCLPIFFG